MAKNKFFGKDLVSFNLFGKKITLGTPHRVELLLVFVYAIFFLWWNELQNKVLDLGLGYEVTWVAGVTTTALDLGIIMLIFFHLALMGLFLMSLRSKKTDKTLDIIVGVLAFFGVAIMLSGFINSIYSDTIRFLFVNMPSINFYHIGIGIESFAGLYWALSQ